jgi:hypothetical protein
MLTKVVERTPDKLILKVKNSSTSIFSGLLVSLIAGIPPCLLGGLGILTSIGELLSNSSYFLIYILVLIVCFGLLLSGGFLVYGAIAFFVIDTTWIFDKSLRKLIIKNPKFSRPQGRRYKYSFNTRPYEYSFDEIANITTELRVETSTSGYRTYSYEVYRLSVLLTSNNVIVISYDEKSPINQEKQAEIVNLIQNYLS